MNNYISFERVWQDNSFFQIKVCCASDIIAATTKTYTSSELINELYCKLKEFLNGKANEIIWKNGEKGDDSTACVSLKFSHKDKVGHVLIETYMELEDGGNFSKHNCCFYLETELGLLFEFNENLHEILEPKLGQKIVLGKD